MIVNIKCFKSILIKFFSLQEISLFYINDPTGVNLLTRRRLKFNHLNEHKFHHNFKDTVVTICDCGIDTETTEHFFLRCPFLATKVPKLFINVNEKHFSSQNLNEESMIDIFLNGCNEFNESHNKESLLQTIDYIKSTKRFERPLIDHWLL